MKTAGLRGVTFSSEIGTREKKNYEEMVVMVKIMTMRMVSSCRFPWSPWNCTWGLKALSCLKNSWTLSEVGW